MTNGGKPLKRIRVKLSGAYFAQQFVEVFPVTALLIEEVMAQVPLHPLRQGQAQEGGGEPAGTLSQDAG